METEKQAHKSDEVQVEIATKLGDFYKSQVVIWRRLITNCNNGSKTDATEHARIILDTIEGAAQRLLHSKAAFEIFNNLASQEKL